MKFKATSKTKWVLAAVLGMITLSAVNNKAYTNPQGAPNGVSGSPADGGLTCTACHSGSDAMKTGFITSTVDTSGYIPGKTYTITTTATKSGVGVFGFEISAQNAAANSNGTFVITNTTQTQSLGKNRITHTSGGISGSTGSKTWTFNWIAPVKGSGTITFYGAYNVGDQDIYRSTLAVKENTASTAGIAIEGAAAGKIGVYPNPVHQTLQYTIVADKESKAIVSLTNINGQIIKSQEEITVTTGTNILSKDVSSLPVGLYLLTVNTNGKIYVQKILIE